MLLLTLTMGSRSKVKKRVFAMVYHRLKSSYDLVKNIKIDIQCL